MASGFSYNQKTRKYRTSKIKRVKINLLSSFMFGVVRGLGMALGFSGIAVVLFYLMKLLPLGDIPFLGDLFRAITQSKK